MIEIVRLLLLWLGANFASGLLAGFLLAPFSGIPGLNEHALFLIKVLLGGGLFYYVLLTKGKTYAVELFSGFAVSAKFSKALKYFSLYLLFFVGIAGAVLLAVYTYARLASVPVGSLTAPMSSSADFERFGSLETLAGWVLYLLGACVLAPLIEEVYYRGLLFTEARKKWNFWISTTITAIVFGLFHPNILLAVLDGAFLCYTFDKEKDLQTNILLHSLLNIFSISMMVALTRFGF